ncbi:hypothetical protein [Planotetraspora phitsanulokensis]|uniref:hypothetical protein n=1 Tax=Planotetraspora phitsanulokensis TaxID=575192 RepID=UPI00194F7CB1|nr:hypothetical protein [Planotetraspora phitsanulokensis]
MNALSIPGVREPSLRQLQELPADPDRLRDWFLSLPNSPTQPAPQVGVTPQGLPDATLAPVPSPVLNDAQINEWLFGAASKMILESPITPAGRAAVLRMLADIPGVELIGKVHDADGRAGTAIAWNHRTPDGKKEVHSQARLIIDVKTGRALAAEDVVTGPNNMLYPGIPIGDVAGTSTVKAGWTDKAPG